MRECSIDQCSRAATRRGMCDSHYRRVRRTGDAGGPIVLGQRPRRKPSDLFWAKVVPSADSDCWTWTGSTSSSGYGQFKERVAVGTTKVWTAHRFAYVDMVGEIPDGLHLDHLCRNRVRVNPEHLDPVTPEENARRTRLAACKRGHAFTPENTQHFSSGRKCRACQQLRAAARRERRAAA